MSDDTLLETTIAEPSMRAGEVEMLLFALERSRVLVDLHDEYARHVGHADPV